MAIETVRRRRKLTAKETARRLGISERKVRRLVAESRDDYEARAEQRRQQALALRQSGLTLKETAEKMGTTWQAVDCLTRRARARMEAQG